jgi:hypothetical protein
MITVAYRPYTLPQANGIQLQLSRWQTLNENKMGAEIHIRTVSDKYDDKEIAPFLGRDFHREIVEGRIWENKKPFLNAEESKLLHAPYYEELDDSISPIHPLELSKVLTKVKNYLKANEDSLPYEIDIDDERMAKEGLSYDLIIKQSRCWIQGDSLYYNVSSKVKIVSYPLEPNKVELWVDIAERVEIDGKRYHLKKISRYDKFSELLDEVIEFCRYAASRNEKIYWLYSY